MPRGLRLVGGKVELERPDRDIRADDTVFNPRISILPGALERLRCVRKGIGDFRESNAFPGIEHRRRSAGSGERHLAEARQTRALPDVFFVIATQNPIESQGTFPLPEAQLDRFLMKGKMDYPTTTRAGPSSRDSTVSLPLRR